MISLEDIEVVLEYLEEKKYASAKCYLENVVREEQETKNKRVREE
jgi:SOS response regulatory protein OraA/RecX